MPASPATKPANAFTLVEVMASLSVLSVLVLMLTSVFDQVSRAWSTSEGNTERRRNSRALADYIGGELRSALLPVESFTSTGKGSLHFVINPSEGMVPNDYRYADAIFWQAPLATETTYGDIAEVGYFVRWDESDTNAPRPVLGRFFVNPSTRDESDTVIRNPNFLIFDKNPTAWLSGALIDGLAPATKDRKYLGLFGDNVLGLWVRSFGLNGQELPRQFDSRIGYACQFDSKETQGYKQQWVEQRYLPARVQISLIQIDAKHAMRLRPVMDQLKSITSSEDIRDADQCLEALRDRSAASPPLRAILPGLRVYTTDVQLQNAR